MNSDLNMKTWLLTPRKKSLFCMVVWQQTQRPSVLFNVGIGGVSWGRKEVTFYRLFVGPRGRRACSEGKSLGLDHFAVSLMI